MKEKLVEIREIRGNPFSIHKNRRYKM